MNEKYSDIEDRKRDIEGLCKILEDYDEVYQDYQLSARINGLLKFLDEEAAEQYKYYNFNSKTSNNGVKIMSIHKSKGLEFNNVFIIGLENGDFPSTYNGGKQYWNVLGTHFEENKIKYKGDIEDERKLFYVAITRAKKNLFLYSQIEKKKISTFLEEAMNFNDLYIDNNSLSNIEKSKTSNSNFHKKNYDEIKKVRDKVLDYYGTARLFYKAAGGDLERCLKMNDEQILEEARKLKII